jgi:hypothetical protein
MSTRQSYVRALNAAGLLDSNSNDSTVSTVSKGTHRFGERDIRLHIDEQFRLEEETYQGKSRSGTRI